MARPYLTSQSPTFSLWMRRKKGGGNEWEGQAVDV